MLLTVSCMSLCAEAVAVAISAMASIAVFNIAFFIGSGQTVAQQITMLAGLTAEDADAALQHILCTCLLYTS